MKKPTFRRIVAFILDLFIVSIIASALSNIKFINPEVDNYESVYEEYMDYLTNQLNVQNANSIIKSEEYSNITYNLNYYGRYSSLITLVVTFLYFVVFQYYTGGYTGGKKLLKIKVKSDKGKLGVGKITLRSLIINNLLTSTLSLLAIFLLNKSNFLKVSTFIEILEMGLLFITFGMVLYRKDGRGLHDLIAGTRVVFDKSKEEI